MPEGKESPTEQRPKIAAMERGPGPKYALPSTLCGTFPLATVKASPKFSMGSRLPRKDVSHSPGPCYSFDSQTLRTGKSLSPSYSLRGRRSISAPPQQPAPGAYSPETVRVPYPSSPAYTMRPRTASKINNEVPGPNSYSLPTLTGRTSPTKAAEPAFTMRPRLEKGGPYEERSKSPGPAEYGAAKPEVLSFNNTAPSFSFRARVYQPAGGTTTPAPGAYVPASPNSPNKGVTFGVKHSPYSVSPLV